MKNDGTTLILLGATETWMQAVAEYTNTVYSGYYNVGKNWVGGIHFVKEHPLFDGLPVNDALNWPYQSVVKMVTADLVSVCKEKIWWLVLIEVRHLSWEQQWELFHVERENNILFIGYCR